MDTANFKEEEEMVMSIVNVFRDLQKSRYFPVHFPSCNIAYGWALFHQIFKRLCMTFACRYTGEGIPVPVNAATIGIDERSY